MQIILRLATDGDEKRDDFTLVTELETQLGFQPDVFLIPNMVGNSVVYFFFFFQTNMLKPYHIFSDHSVSIGLR